MLAYIGLGANLGDPVRALQLALHDLAAVPQLTLTQQSPLYGSAPIDSSGPNYVNAVAEVSTTLSAPALLQVLQQLELQAGRQRPYRNAPRTLDLDLLLYGGGTISSSTLTVPHPRMQERAFVLRPLADIAPSRVQTLALEAVRDQALWRLTPGASG